MPTDAERWRFLADHRLTLHTDSGDYGYMVHWCRTSGPGQPPKFYPVSNGKTAEEAIDHAIKRYSRKRGIATASVEVGVRWMRNRPSAFGRGASILNRELRNGR